MHFDAEGGKSPYPATNKKIDSKNLSNIKKELISQDRRLKNPRLTEMRFSICDLDRLGLEEWLACLFVPRNIE